MDEGYNFLSLVSQSHAVVEYQPGAIIFRKGDRADGMYVVRSGKVELFDGATIYETVTAGNIFGEMALVDNLPRSASARAGTYCHLIWIHNPAFMRLVEQSPMFAVRVMRVMGKRLRTMNERLQTAIASLQAPPGE
jgi:CRP-like cAMP-binding protein